MTKYKPARDIPKFARELGSLDLDDLRTQILKKRNKDVKNSSIKMWLHRHPKIHAEIEKEFKDEHITDLEVTDNIFLNGTFEALTTVDLWNRHMVRNNIVARKGYLSTLKNICKGTFRGWNMPNWTPQHPDRLTQEDVLKIVDYCMTHNKFGEETDDQNQIIEDAHIRIVARNFFLANNKPCNQISGSKSKGFGKYNKMVYSTAKINSVIKDVYSKNQIAGTVSLFMFKTATRISATLKALIEDIEVMTIDGKQHVFIHVYDKARRSKHPRGKKWTKYVPPELYYRLLDLIGDRRFGKIFNVDYDTVTKLNKDAIIKHIPELLEQFPKFKSWNHFYRHMFAQTMLRLTNWNLQAVSELGGWSPMALEESYGKPPIDQVRKWGLTFIPKI